MLNNPGDDLSSEPKESTTEESAGSHVRQIIVIAFVGIYLFGVVWLYAHLPWLAVTVTGVAIVIMICGFIRALRRTVPKTEP